MNPQRILIRRSHDIIIKNSIDLFYFVISGHVHVEVSTFKYPQQCMAQIHNFSSFNFIVARGFKRKTQRGFKIHKFCAFRPTGWSPSDINLRAMPNSNYSYLLEGY